MAKEMELDNNNNEESYIKKATTNKDDWNQLDHLSSKERISKLAGSREEIEHDKKQSMQYNIDRADSVFQVLLLIFGLGFWIVMIMKLFM